MVQSSAYSITSFPHRPSAFPLKATHISLTLVLTSSKEHSLPQKLKISSLFNKLTAFDGIWKFIAMFTGVFHWSPSGTSWVYKGSVQVWNVASRNMLVSYSDCRWRPSSQPIAKVKKCPLPAALEYLFNVLMFVIISVAGGRFLHSRPEDAPCRHDKRSIYRGTLLFLISIKVPVQTFDVQST
jgi:hypothetical protein